ncbi:MAG: N-acyl homoserine lactonase family protein [Acidimicrobiales bacterium]
MKLRILNHGAMHSDLIWLLLKPMSTIADRSHKDMPRPWVEVPTHTVLIEHPEGKILWDTSCPSNWEQHWAVTGFQEFFPYDGVTEEQYFENSLKAHGLGPEDIDYVILSHLHFDHAGNVHRFKGTGAKLVCTKAERDGAFGFDGAFLGAHLRADYEGLEFETVEGDTEILPGITIIEAPGHTWGTCALKVDLPNSGTYIFTSDAVYRGDSWGPPAVGAAIVWNNLQWLSSVDKLRGIAEKSNATMVFGHDADQIKTLRTGVDDYYD